MSEQDEWEATLERAQTAGFRTLFLESKLDDDWWTSLTDAEPPVAVRAFARRWLETPDDPWQVLLDSVAAANPEALAEIEEDAHSLRGLRSLVSRIEHVAIAHRKEAHWAEEDLWGYLVQFRHARDADRYGHVMLYPLALPADIQQAEYGIHLKLPTTYRHFLLLTNGFHIGASWPNLCDIYGVGPQRANWTDVLLNNWQECEKFREIAAMWPFWASMTMSASWTASAARTRSIQMKPSLFLTHIPTSTGVLIARARTRTAIILSCSGTTRHVARQNGIVTLATGSLAK
jgi:hypothetical protein